MIEHFLGNPVSIIGNKLHTSAGASRSRERVEMIVCVISGGCIDFKGEDSFGR